MSKTITSDEEMNRYLTHLGYAREGNETRLPALVEVLKEAGGGEYPFLIHQVRDGLLPLDAEMGTKPDYRPWLSWFLVTGVKGHQQVHCEDILLSIRRKETDDGNQEP